MTTLPHAQATENFQEYELQVVLWQNLQRLFNCAFFTRMVAKSQQKLQHALQEMKSHPPQPEHNEDPANPMTSYAVTIQQLAPDAFGEEYDWL
jgi:hypothetical protein